MFYVVREGKLKCFELLVERECKFDESDVNGQTPLFFAARENRLEIAKRMVELGAKTDTLDNISK